VPFVKYVSLSLVLVTFMCTVQPLWVWAEDGTSAKMRLGMDEYRDHEYKDAIDHFSAALSDEFSNPKLHYYTANCLICLHQREAAIREYRIAYALDPEGPLAKLCIECLRRFGIDATGVKTHRKKKTPIDSGKTAKASDTPGHKPSTDTKDASAASAKPSAVPSYAPQNLPIARFRMPAKETPEAKSILSDWSIDDKANYIEQARDRKQSAIESLDQAQQILTKAQALAASIVPSARSYGESEEQFRQRKAECQSKYDLVLAPYKKDVDDMTKVVNDESAVYEACRSVSRR
jgi:tetratricopeptide (TPR) repeat protein